MATWEIRGHYLGVCDDSGSFVIPDLKYVLESARKQNDCTDCGQRRIADDLPELKFSRIGGQLSLRLSLVDDALLVMPCVSRMGKTTILADSPMPIPGHAVVDNVWIHFSGMEDEANRALEEAGISEIGPIKIADGSRLVRAASTHQGLEIDTGALCSLKKAVESHPVDIPASLQAKLYPYQEVGYSWLSFIAEQADGCVLADEMGLGKTLQVITFLLSRKEKGGGTSLVICPVSLLENWKRELGKFAPSLDVLVHQGSNRSGRCDYLSGFDVVVMSYDTAKSDLGMLQMGDWDVVVLDEAQAVKNAASQRSAMVREIPRRFGLAVSGTPFENHIGDVWGVLAFAEPELLGDYESFSRNYTDDLEGAAELEAVISPFVLRRRVADVGSDLPAKMDIPSPVRQFEGEEEDYEMLRRDTIEGASQSPSLATLTKLRMFCCHPLLLEGRRAIEASDPFSSSAKYRMLVDILFESSEAQEKALVFTSYREMIGIIERDIPKRIGIPVLRVDGSIPPKDRQSIVDTFSAIEGPAVLVLNPAAAGTGLNITAANRVIHYNPEWNPAKEDQASARAWRRGQEHTVFVHRLFCADTVEEIVIRRMEEKREMAESAIVGTDGVSRDRAAIVEALEISPVKGGWS